MDDTERAERATPTMILGGLQFAIGASWIVMSDPKFMGVLFLLVMWSTEPFW
jgi:hypothetical protein